VSINRRHIGFSLPTFSVTIASERLTQFADAIEESNPELREVIAPPTFLKVIEGEGGSSRRILDNLEVDLRRVLHAEQQFDYFLPVRVGDEITVERKVADIYDKKGGHMEFIVIETQFFNATGQNVALSRQIVLVRQPKKREL
jgi:hydroxyacyl-ACP dehydratase HTD2-like protein with hotdog domain